MSDKFMEIYDAEMKKLGPGATVLQVFQTGFTAAAVSMRKRAMDCCDKSSDHNEIKNKIGSLSDIPTE